MIENEDDDPVGQPHRDPRQVFTELAVKHGLIRAGDKLDQNMVDFANDIVAACADIGDQYGDDDANAGAHIRAELGD